MTKNNTEYDLYQVDDLTFRYDMSYAGAASNMIDDWLCENFEEGIDFQFGESLYGTHAYTSYIIFYHVESAVAFKLRWA